MYYLNKKVKIIISAIIFLLLLSFVGVYYYAVTNDNHKNDSISLSKLSQPTNLSPVITNEPATISAAPGSAYMNNQIVEPMFSSKNLNNYFYSKSFYLFHPRFTNQVIEYCSNNALTTQTAVNNCNLAFNNNSKAQLFTALYGVGYFIYNETPIFIWILLGLILFIHLIKLVLQPLNTPRTASKNLLRRSDRSY